MIALILLALAALSIIYILIGYPLLIRFFPWRTAAPVQKDMTFRTSVSVLIAVQNGESFIGSKLDNLLSLEYPSSLINIVVVSDGSTDATDTIVESYARRRVRLVRAPRGGKSAALNVGLRHATGEILFFTDVRQRLELNGLTHLIANFADPSVGAVSGEPRFIDPDRLGEEADMELYWRYELWMRRQHSRIDSILNTTGWIYAVRRSLAQPIPPDTLTDDAVIPLTVFFKGYRVVVEPQALAFDYPRIHGGEFSRKIRTLAGLWQVHARWPQLFTRANRMRLHFLSHKSSRLFLPWAIVLFFGATLALPSSLFQQLLLIGELSLTGLALIDSFVPKSVAPLKRISSPARSFLVMNAAALLSIVVFIVPPEKLWKPTKVSVSPRNGAQL